jgi:PBP1b-binding outer membrane lipoprotein LpoB
MRRYMLVFVVMAFAGALVLSACSSGKAPAEEALKAAEQAVNGAKAEAAKIVPDQVKSLEGALSSAKDKFEKKDYKAALADAQAIPGKVKEVIDAAKAKKEELTKSWTNLSEGLPKMVEAIKSRVDILSKSKKLPANLPKEKFEEVKSGLGTALTDWAAAQDSFKTGNVGEAVSKANSIKEKAVQFMQTLGMPVPEGAKS